MSRPNAAVWALTLLALVGCRRAPPGRVAESTEPSLFRVAPEKRAHLEVVTAAETPVTLPVDVPAVVNFDELKTSRVVPLVSGRVASVLVHEGDRVKAGQALMTIASPDASDTRASLTRDQAALQAENVILTRDKDLYAHKAISLEELQQAELAVSALEATVRDDQAHVTITGGAGSHAIVTTPIAGVVVSRAIAVGEAVQAGTTLCFTVTDPSAVWVVAQLYQEDLRQIVVGDAVQIRSPVLTTPLRGSVEYIGASIDTDTLTIPVRIAASNPDGLLKKGMYVQAEIIPARATKAIVVPDTAILRDVDNLPFVFVEAEPGAFARQHVDVGPQVASGFVLRGGLHAGQKVLADGALFVEFAQSLGR